MHGISVLPHALMASEAPITIDASPWCGVCTHFVEFTSRQSICW
jgi:hypothetical protein